LYEFKCTPEVLTEGETANQKGNPTAVLVVPAKKCAWSLCVAGETHHGASSLSRFI